MRTRRRSWTGRILRSNAPSISTGSVVPPSYGEQTPPDLTEILRAAMNMEPRHRTHGMPRGNFRTLIATVAFHRVLRPLGFEDTRVNHDSGILGVKIHDTARSLDRPGVFDLASDQHMRQGGFQAHKLAKEEPRADRYE
jgi:hypothetical protein